MLRIIIWSQLFRNRDVQDIICLKSGEGFDTLRVSVYPEDIESDSLGKRPTLTNSDDISVVDSESGRGVCREVLVSFLVPSVFGNKL